MKNCNKGQSLIELLIAMAIFVLVISAITFLILDSYIAHRAGREVTLATFLAEEGLEAARSIRDNDWADLTDGSHGIATSVDGWVFQGTEEDISNQLGEGIRKVIVESLDADRKKVQSQITWEFTEARLQEVILVTYLTNWQKEIFTVSFSSEAYSILEDGGNLTITVNLSEASKDIVSVDYNTVDGTAIAPDDYIAVSDTLVFDPGDVLKTFDVFIVDDEKVEFDEFFYLILSNPQNAVLGDPSQATATILDNDGAPSGCWGTGGSCDPLCRYADYGPLTGWYDNPDPLCNATCSITGYFYLNPSGVCSNDGSGSCYKMENLLSASTTYTEGDPCEEGCARTCTPCEQLNRQQCRQQEGCDWDWWQRQCVDDPGCISCDEFPDPPSCGPGPNQPQYGCSWESTKWYWDLADSLEGYLASTTCQWYE